MKLNIHLLLCTKRHYIDEIEYPPSPICGEKSQFVSNVISFQFRQNAEARWWPNQYLESSKIHIIFCPFFILNIVAHSAGNLLLTIWYDPRLRLLLICWFLKARRFIAPLPCISAAAAMLILKTSLKNVHKVASRVMKFPPGNPK